MLGPAVEQGVEFDPAVVDAGDEPLREVDQARMAEAGRDETVDVGGDRSGVHVQTIERLEGDLTGTGTAGCLHGVGSADARGVSMARSEIISSAAVAHSAPLLPAKASAGLPAARAMACASVSHVSTPNGTGRP